MKSRNIKYKYTVTNKATGKIDVCYNIDKVSELSKRSVSSIFLGLKNKNRFDDAVYIIERDLICKE